MVQFYVGEMPCVVVPEAEGVVLGVRNRVK